MKLVIRELTKREEATAKRGCVYRYAIAEIGGQKVRKVYLRLQTPIDRSPGETDTEDLDAMIGVWAKK